MDDWREAVEREREQKAQYFREHPRSPVAGGAFAGLEYFEIDPDYRFEIPLQEHEDKERITVETTAEGEQEYVRYGAFDVEIDGQAVTIQAYRPASGDERLWVPFRDATSGETTYGSGRYLDLDFAEDRTADGEWVLDFNRAYNPTCAYNYAYECPLVPRENWLEVPVEAGEKDYPGDPVEPDHGHHH
jgi:hypothetical protein